MEVYQDGCYLIYDEFSLKSVDRWRNLFYVVIDAL